MPTRSAAYFKLGLLTLVALFAAVIAAFALGLRSDGAARVDFHTYFDESVQGLSIDSPVTYRGVHIGRLTGIEIAPDRKHVDVTLALDFNDVERLGLDQASPGVRAQLGSQGITGIKFVEIDFFDPATNPPPKLTFLTAPNYIPAEVSLFKGLENNLEIVVQRLPTLIDDVTATLHRIEGMVDELHDQHLPARIANTIDHINSSMLAVRDLVRHVDRAQLPAKLTAAIDQLTTSLADASAVFKQIGGQHGLVASTQRATDAIGDLTSRASTLALERTLQDLDGAAQAIRELADTLDREPDMLVKGRARTHER